jgi:hypothetical protein
MRQLVFLPVALLLALSGVADASLQRKLGAASELVGIQSGGAFDALAENIADTAARSLPIISSSAGFTYRYNPQLEVFERTSETLGPLYMERPDTLGRGKFNFSVSHQYVELNTFDGQSLKDLENNDPIVVRAFDASGNPIGFRANRLRYSLGLQNQVTAFSGTYGITDDLDVNLLVPVIFTNMRVGVHSTEVATAGLDGVFSPSSGFERVGHTKDDAFGVGDLLLRLKYQLPRLRTEEMAWLRSALGLEVRFPTGSSENFQGTGAFELTPSLFLSTILWDRVEPELNVGFDFNAGDVSRSAARYAAGVDVDVTKIFNVNVAFLGRSQFEGTADPRDTEFLHLQGGHTATEPLLGLDFGRKDTLDFSFGFRVVVWKNLMVFANGIYAVNDDGLRNDTIIPAGGIEGTF